MLGQILLAISSFWMMINLTVHPPDFYAMVSNDLGGDSAVKAVQTGYINVEGGKLYYEEAGWGETIVFLHDGMVHSVTWNEQFDRFAENFRVIRYDRRGYGQSNSAGVPYSDVKDLGRVFKQLEISEAHLIGCSAGGRLAINFTLAHPEKVKSLVLVGAPVSGMSFTDHFYTRGGLVKSAFFSDPEHQDSPFIIALNRISSNSR